MTVDIDRWVDRDLGAAARDLLPAFEVDDLVAQAEEVLRASGSRTPVLVGANGVGKTAIIHELVRRAHVGTGVPLLRQARVLQFSMRAISARFKEKSDGANFFGELVSAILASPDPIVPFFKDIHLAYVLDWEPSLHRLLSSLPHGALGEGLPRELDQLVDYWSDLSEHLVPIPIEEPPTDKVRAIVARWCEHQQGRGRTFRPEAQRGAIELTARFMGDRPFPRKVLELLRQTADFTPAEDGEPRPVTLRDVVRRFGQLTRVPERLVDPDHQLDLAEVHDFVAQRLLGQDEAVDAVVRMIALMKAGLADLRRPFGTFLFVGPTGVGKTFCAQLLAEYLFGDAHRLLRLNLADYGEAYHVAVLFGDPHGHSPNDQRGLLTRRLAGNPFGVLLLDEFEKAHPKVHDAFLQLVDEGRFINGRSEVVSVASLIVIATSNAGAEVYRETGLGFERRTSVTDLDRELDRRLHRQFRFELLNRFDRVVHFHPLDRHHIRAIAKRELTDLGHREGLQMRQLQLEIDAEVLDWLVAHGWHPHYGARFLRREIERSVAGTLAEFVVREHPPRSTRVALGVRHGRIEARTVALPPAPRLLVPGTQGRPDAQVDADQLLVQARDWVERFAPLIEESRKREAEASALIAQSNSDGFWDDHDQAQELLRRYKDLDARVQTDRRLVRPVQRLERILDGEHGVEPEELAALLQNVATAYRRWLDIGSDTGPSGVWLVLGPADASADHAGWLQDLVTMYRGWFRRRGLQSELVAEEVERGRPVRLVFEVEGPAVGRLLEMERGEHRRKPVNGPVERALVEVVPRSEASEAPGPRVEDCRRAAGTLIERRVARVELDLRGRGLKLRLFGTSRPTLAWLARDLVAAMAAPSDVGGAIARTYGLHGGAAHDPRTNTSVPALKDVLRGHLDPFQRAWETR